MIEPGPFGTRPPTHPAHQRGPARRLGQDAAEGLRLACALFGGRMRSVAQPWSRYHRDPAARPEIGAVWDICLWDGICVGTVMTSGASLVPMDRVSDEMAMRAGFESAAALRDRMPDAREVHLEGLRIVARDHATDLVRAEVRGVHDLDRAVLVLAVQQGFLGLGQVLHWPGGAVRIVSLSEGYGVFCQIEVVSGTDLPMRGDVLVTRAGLT